MGDFFSRLRSATKDGFSQKKKTLESVYRAMGMRIWFSIGWSEARALRRAMERHGAGDAEVAALERLEDFRAELIDLERLQGLAALAKLPWKELFPELLGHPLE